MRTCTCGVISHLYRNKLDVAEKGKEGPGAKALVGRLRAVTPPQGPGTEPLSGGFSAARRRTTKCNFTANPQAGKKRFLCLFQTKDFILKCTKKYKIIFFLYLKNLIYTCD